MSQQNHPYHLVDLSPWPILSAFSLLFVTGGAVMFMHHHPIGHIIFGIGLVTLFACAFCWWRDVVAEGRAGNHHTDAVRIGLRIGMALFIISEIMFFFGFFWSFFKASLFPEGILDDAGLWVTAQGMWPPKGIEVFDPWDIPFMNTLILLLSGTTVTWAHHEVVVEDNQPEAARALGYTVLLGIFFTIMQAYEYMHAPFKFTDGIYASNFYMATGFHGVHVIIGTIFLAVCYFRAKRGHFASGNGHLGFEFAAWYWHFVDVVWLFLFAFVYVWGD